jgi:glycosyltransferase involved in cell wall biosynthesis
LVLPSYYENFPLVLLEAAAAGLAIITTPVGATPEFFEDGVSALFVSPGDTKGLAEAIVSMIEDPERRMQLANEARKTFRARLGREKIMAALEEVYDQVAG